LGDCVLTLAPALCDEHLFNLGREYVVDAGPFELPGNLRLEHDRAEEIPEEFGARFAFTRTRMVKSLATAGSSLSK
jgi:hypothetical protein